MNDYKPRNLDGMNVEEWIKLENCQITKYYGLTCLLLFIFLLNERLQDN